MGNGNENAQPLEKAGGYISVDPGVAIKRNLPVIEQIRELVHESQKTSSPTPRAPETKTEK